MPNPAIQLDTADGRLLLDNNTSTAAGVAFYAAHVNKPDITADHIVIDV